MSYYPTRLKI